MDTNSCVRGASERAMRRNSSVELLRIVSMFMILVHHFVVHNGFDAASLPIGPTRFILEVFFEGSGKVGVVVFFAISSWYLLDREQGLRDSLRRIWLMEGQLLFYGICLYGFVRLVQPGALSGRDLLRSLLPLGSSCWWYMSSYAGFLLLLPFLQKGLRALDERAHGSLCLVIVLVWGLLPMVPGSAAPSTVSLGSAVWPPSWLTASGTWVAPSDPPRSSV